MRKLIALDAIKPVTPGEAVYVEYAQIAALIPVYDRAHDDRIDEHGNVVGVGVRNVHSGYHVILRDTYSSMHIMVGITERNVKALSEFIVGGELVLPERTSDFL